MSSDSGASGGKRDAVHRPTVVAKLEQGIATWALLLRTAKNPEDRRKAMKNIRELQRRLSMARGRE